MAKQSTGKHHIDRGRFKCVGIYGRVSTNDNNQDPATQLLPLREFVSAQGWATAAEYVDRASATDLRGRTAWRDLLTLAAPERIGTTLLDIPRKIANTNALSLSYPYTRPSLK